MYQIQQNYMLSKFQSDRFTLRTVYLAVNLAAKPATKPFDIENTHFWAPLSALGIPVNSPNNQL